MKRRMNGYLLAGLIVTGLMAALILVGPFLGDEYHYSKLYAADFSHEYRKA